MFDELQICNHGKKTAWPARLNEGDVAFATSLPTAQEPHRGPRAAKLGHVTVTCRS